MLCWVVFVGLSLCFNVLLFCCCFCCFRWCFERFICYNWLFFFNVFFCDSLLFLIHVTFVFWHCVVYCRFLCPKAFDFLAVVKHCEAHCIGTNLISWHIWLYWLYLLNFGFICHYVIFFDTICLCYVMFVVFFWHLAFESLLLVVVPQPWFFRGGQVFECNGN